MIIDMEHHYSTVGQLERRGRTKDSQQITRSYKDGKMVGFGASWAATDVNEHLNFMDNRYGGTDDELWGGPR